MITLISFGEEMYRQFNFCIFFPPEYIWIIRYFYIISHISMLRKKIPKCTFSSIRPQGSSPGGFFFNFFFNIQFFLSTFCLSILCPTTTWLWYRPLLFRRTMQMMIIIMLHGESLCIQTVKNITELTYSSQRDWRLSASWVSNWRPPWNHHVHQGTIILKGALIIPTDACFSDSRCHFFL